MGIESKKWISIPSWNVVVSNLLLFSSTKIVIDVSDLKTAHCCWPVPCLQHFKWHSNSHKVGKLFSGLKYTEVFQRPPWIDRRRLWPHPCPHPRFKWPRFSAGTNRFTASIISTRPQWPSGTRFRGSNPSTRPFTPSTISSSSSQIPFSLSKSVNTSSALKVRSFWPLINHSVQYKDHSDRSKHCWCLNWAWFYLGMSIKETQHRSLR